MKRQYVPTEEEYKKIIEKAEREPIDCPICGARLFIYWKRRKPKRKYFDNCDQHIVLSEAVQTFILN